MNVNRNQVFQKNAGYTLFNHKKELRNLEDLKVEPAFEKQEDANQIV